VDVEGAGGRQHLVRAEQVGALGEDVAGQDHGRRARRIVDRRGRQRALEGGRRLDPLRARRGSGGADDGERGQDEHERVGQEFQESVDQTAGAGDGGHGWLISFRRAWIWLPENAVESDGVGGVVSGDSVEQS
jgi:hypothetical protein